MYRGKLREIDTASEHYIEKLVLLPSNNIHQYYNPVFKGGISTITKQTVNNSSRDILFPDISGKRWYVCITKAIQITSMLWQYVTECFGKR